VAFEETSIARIAKRTKDALGFDSSTSWSGWKTLAARACRAASDQRTCKPGTLSIRAASDQRTCKPGTLSIRACRIVSKRRQTRSALRARARCLRCAWRMKNPT